MQSLRVVSQCRAHTPRTIHRTISNRTRRSNDQSSSSSPSPSPSSSPPADDDERPPKTYAELHKTPPSLARSEEKLRHLISLFHSSSSFITPETLSDEIDKAFTPMRVSQARFRSDSYQDLIYERDRRAAEPDRVVPTSNEMDGKNTTYDRPSGGWSSSQSERARMVKSALWGVDPMGNIGLETLIEAKAEMDSFREPAETKAPGKES